MSQEATSFGIMPNTNSTVEPTGVKQDNNEEEQGEQRAPGESNRHLIDTVESK